MTLSKTALKYTVIKSEEQFERYCDILEELVQSKRSNEYREEIELLTLLIEDWQERKYPISNMDPVELLESLMEDHQLNQTDLADIAGVGKSYISEILNRKKSMSKKIIRNLSDYFKIRQEAWN